MEVITEVKYYKELDFESLGSEVDLGYGLA